jgi:hypothetical protein
MYPLQRYTTDKFVCFIVSVNLMCLEWHALTITVRSVSSKQDVNPAGKHANGDRKMSGRFAL